MALSPFRSNQQPDEHDFCQAEWHSRPCLAARIPILCIGIANFLSTNSRFIEIARLKVKPKTTMPSNPTSYFRAERQPGRVLVVSRRGVLMGGAGWLLAGCSTGGFGSADASAPQTSLATSQSQAGAAATLSGATVKVGLVLPFGKGGDAGKIAAGLKQAAELALFDVNGASIALIPKDSRGTAEGAAAAAREAIAAGAELIIGPLFAQEVQGVATVAQQANVPVVAFSSDRSVAGNGVYLLSFLAGEDVNRVVSYASAGGRHSFAALIPQTPYGAVVEKVFHTAVLKAGGRVALIEHYAVDANAVADPVNRLKSAFVSAKAAGTPIDALLLPGGQDVLPIVAPMLPYNAIDTKSVKLLGTGGWDYPAVSNEAALIGGWFAGPDPAGWADFSGRYAKSYGTQPVRLASLGYDAVTLALALAANPAGQRFTSEKLTRSSGFAGVDGLFRLRPDGTCERGLAILEVAKFGTHAIDAAPSAFNVAQF